MIKIQKDDAILTVTPSAFKTIFKSMGFKVVESEKTVEPVVEQEVEKTEDEKFIDEIVIKPISSWTKEELARVVSITGIDTSNAKTVKEAKEIVKEALGI